MSVVDTAALRATAEAATPGVWKLWGMTVMADQDGTSNVDTAVGVAQTFYRDEHGKPRTWDAAHIAAFDPPTVLALLAELDTLRATVARIEAVADQWNGTPDYTPSDYDQGRVEQRHDMTGQLLAALVSSTPDPTRGDNQ